MEETLNRPANFGGAKLIIGIFLVIHGLLLTADNLGALDAWRILRYWPAVLLLVGLYKIWQPGRQLAGAILIILGASLLASNAGLIRLTLFDFWPLLLIIGGVIIVARATGVEVKTSGSHTLIGVLSTQKVAMTEFSGARAAAFMGAVILDLTEATMPRNDAVVEAFAMWGGVEIYVPANWEVTGEVVPFMAGFEIKSAPSGTPQRRLIVRGAAIMGGIEVKRRSA